MFLSFIVPVYNTEAYLGECLRSIYAQNLSYDEYEVICVNDGSTDNSLNILKQYQQKFSNLRIINQENRGGICSS